MVSLILSVLFRIPIEAQFCRCRKVYRGYFLKASWSGLIPSSPRATQPPVPASVRTASRRQYGAVDR